MSRARRKRGMQAKRGSSRVPKEGPADSTEAADPNLVQALCPAEDADHDLVELLARDEQQPGLDRAVRDLDEGASLRDEADAHPRLVLNKGGRGVRSPWMSSDRPGCLNDRPGDVQASKRRAAFCAQAAHFQRFALQTPECSSRISLSWEHLQTSGEIKKNLTFVVQAAGSGGRPWKCLYIKANRVDEH